MKNKPIHFIDGYAANLDLVYTACGVWFREKNENVTLDRNAVTCKNCKRTDSFIFQDKYVRGRPLPPKFIIKLPTRLPPGNYNVKIVETKVTKNRLIYTLERM